VLGLFDGLLLGLFDGLGDFDGLLDGLFDGLGDLDGLLDGLLLGLGLEVADGLGLLEALLLGLGLFDELEVAPPEPLALGEPAGWLWPPVSRVADVTWAVPLAHGELVCLAVAANAGAIVRPATRKDPATVIAAARPARAIPAGTITLLRAVRLRPYLRA
jgi:hypothetical protein